MGRQGEWQEGRSMRIQVGDVRLFVDVEGLGLVPEGPAMRLRPTLVTLHGGPGFDHSPLKELVGALADVAQIIYFDYRGHGRSDRSTPDRWTLDTWVDDLMGLLTALEIERPILLGGSYGGTLGLAFAARYPAVPAKLIALSPLAHMRLDLVLSVFERLGGTTARDVAERFWTDPTPEHLADYRQVCMPLYTRTPAPDDVPRRIRVNPELIDRWGREEALQLDLRPKLGAIQCPTLILVGADDPITPEETGDEIAALMRPDLARCVHFERAGHQVLRDTGERARNVIRVFILEEGAKEGPPLGPAPSRRNYPESTVLAE